MKVVTVIPLEKSANKGALSYFTSRDVPDMSIVTVPFRSKKILGLAIGSEDVSGSKGDIKEMDFNLRKILDVKEHSIFRKEYLEAVMELSRYSAADKSNAAASLIPVIFREEYDALADIFKNPAGPAEIKIDTKKAKHLVGAEKMIFQVPPEERISSYKTLIREAFAAKKSVFIVLPTERDIRSVHESLSKGIEQFSFTLHGGISKKKIMEKLEKISSTDHGLLILGTAPYLSVPRHDIGTIIVEHESSNGYKMITKPHFDLRVFAEIFASKINAKLILSDTLLRFETIARKSHRDDIDSLAPFHPLSFRINFDGETKVLGTKRENTDKKFSVFTDRSLEEINTAVQRKKNVFIFSLRKGLATMTVCRDCGDTVSCKNCEAPLVLHYSKETEAGQKRIFVCNRCQSVEDGDTVCASCGSWNLMPLGIGTDTVYDEIKNHFPEYEVWKLDKESAKNASGAAKIVKEFESREGAILVGTEMALFYLNNEIPLSVIASFDSLWSIPNFKMSEKIIQLIISIIRNTGERFIIQTKNEQDPAILAVGSGNLLSFIREELSDRKNLGYPPFKRFIKITHMGTREEAVTASEILHGVFKDYEPELFSGFVAKEKGKYVTNALIKLDPKNWSLPELAHDSTLDETLLKKLISLPYNFQVSVDPEDLL